MSTRENFGTGTKWEGIIGYSRAVRVGNIVHVAGTTATDPATGHIVGVDDMHAQTVQTLQNIERALKLAGAELRHVVRTRLYLTDISQWEAAGRAHGEFFSEIRPVTAMIEVSRLINSTMLIEIEAEAIIE